jgi:chemotaxis protein methyltransferase CheR
MSMNASSLEFIRKLVMRRSAIALDESKEYLVHARLLPLVRTLGLSSIDQLVVELRKHPDGHLADQVVDAMTTNETSFFRDALLFDALRDDIIPHLLACRASSRRLSIWCAACSTGQEPYSVAMLIREHFRAHRDWDVRILASDISYNALAQAEEGRYGDVEIQRGLPPALRDKYFQRRGGYWWIVDEIRSMVSFQLLNLIGDWPALPPMDIVLLRNVMVYFETETKRRVLSRVRGQLRDDGYLFLGGVETTLLLDDAFVRIQNGRFSYYQLRRPSSGGKSE